jgi:hypothetical protein
MLRSLAVLLEQFDVGSAGSLMRRRRPPSRATVNELHTSGFSNRVFVSIGPIEAVRIHLMAGIRSRKTALPQDNVFQQLAFEVLCVCWHRHQECEYHDETFHGMFEWKVVAATLTTL